MNLEQNIFLPVTWGLLFMLTAFLSFGCICVSQLLRLIKTGGLPILLTGALYGLQL